MLVETLIVLVVWILWWKLEDSKHHKGCPPGPARFPVVGNFPQFALTKSSFPASAMDELADEYGDVMSVKIGNFSAVVFSSHKAITKLYEYENGGSPISRGPQLMPVMNDRIMCKNLGIIWSYGDPAKVMRRFTLRTLRDFGFGKTLSMDFVVNEEFDKFKEYFDKELDKAPNNVVKIESFFDLTVVNILWRLVTGVNYKMGDPKICRLLHISNDFVKTTNFGVDLSVAFPSLHKYLGRKKQFEFRDILLDFCHETIQEHRESGRYIEDPQGFVDVFLAKIDEMKSSDEADNEFTDEQLIILILDLFQAGAETSSKTLSFGLLYMLLNPRVQQKVQNEIDSLLSKDESITMSLRPKLPFCHAAVLETLRMSDVVPFPPLRKSYADFNYEGYLIKKAGHDTALLINIHSVHYNEGVWGDPEEFRPERFLTAEGTIDPKMADLVLAFGGGKRMCLGIQLAECNLFLYFTSMMRHYKFEKIPGEPIPSTVPILGMTCGPQPFSAKVTQRF